MGCDELPAASAAPDLNDLSDVLAALSGFLGTPREDPQRLRRDVLAHLCELWSAQSGWLIPCGPRQDALLTEALHWGKEADPSKYREKIHRTLRDKGLLMNRETVRFEGELHELALFKLHLAGRTLGVMALLSRENAFPPSLEQGWLPVAAMVSQLEENLRLSALVENSLRRVRELARDSRRIARRNSRLGSDLAASQRRLNGIAIGVLQMQEDERSKISRELHDGVGQALTALKINIDLVRAEVGEAASRECLRRLSETRRLAEQSIEEIRQLSRLLRPPMLDDLGLSSTLRWYVRTLARRTALEIELDDRSGRQRLPQEVETLLFRVTQEGLNNIVKHSGAQTARVRIDCSPDEIVLKIADDGAGFDPSRQTPEPSRGSGLRGIRDRVAVVGGRFNIDSQPGRGTRLEIRLPSRMHIS